MISFDEAIGLVRTVATPLGSERVTLANAAGRVLARPVVARIDSPRADVSAMDGYAVREADLARCPTTLRVVGESHAGKSWRGELGAGECARIFTGAAVPAGADRIIIQEDVQRDGDRAVISQVPGRGRYIRVKGSDFRAGEELLAAGRKLDAKTLVAAAAADVAELEVHRQPIVRILSTGDELAEPGTAADHADAVPESVSLGIATLAECWGGRCAGRLRLADDLESMRKSAAAAAAGADVVVVTGGASVGEKDFAKAMFEPAGLALIFSKVAMRPGKPVWLGRAADALVIGLPGNPTSALVTARLLLAPLLASLTGRGFECALDWQKLSLVLPLGPCDARETFHRARLADGKVEILAFQDSSAQKALAQADLLVRQAANSPPLAAGSEVEVLGF